MMEGVAGGPIVPTEQADASRALVGDTTLSEHYSFAGVHHVFEQHSNAGGHSNFMKFCENIATIVTRIRFANDERSRLCIASMDGSLSICNVLPESGKSAVVTMLKGHTQGVTGSLVSTCM